MNENYENMNENYENMNGNYTFNSNQNYNFNNQNYEKPKSCLIGIIGSVLQLGMYVLELILLLILFIVILTQKLSFEEILFDTFVAIFEIIIISILPSITCFLMQWVGLKQKMNTFVLVCFRINMTYLMIGVGCFVWMIF